MIQHNSISMLTCVGLAAIASACSTPSEQQSVHKVELPPDAIGRLDTQTTRTLPYTLREDNGQATTDTGFLVLFGSGQVAVPLEAFYGPSVAGETGRWPVDGRGRVAPTVTTSTPGFVNRLECMPNGPIHVGDTWELVTPSDAEAMASSDIVVQAKRRWTVVESVSMAGSIVVRVRVEGWSRIAQNAGMTRLTDEIGFDNIQPNWAPSLDGVIDVDLASGTLLGMRLHEDLFGDADTPDDLASLVGSSTYCIDPNSGFTPRADICGWNL